MEEIAPGIRFYPTEEELVSFYLCNQLRLEKHEINRVIPLVQIYQFEPWQLPSKYNAMFSMIGCKLII